MKLIQQNYPFIFLNIYFIYLIYLFNYKNKGIFSFTWFAANSKHQSPSLYKTQKYKSASTGFSHIHSSPFSQNTFLITQIAVKSLKHLGIHIAPPGPQPTGHHSHGLYMKYCSDIK